MAKNKQMIVISLGGSIIIPDKIQVAFLKEFKKFILKFLKNNYQFIIVAGGGAIAREYQNAAAKITQVSDEDKDWLGINATYLNAHLLKTIFKKEAYPIVLDSPHKKINGEKYNLFIASGWRPGCSTDYDTVLLAQKCKANKIINASNIIYVYEKDIALNPNARPIKKITWQDYRKLISDRWKPGMSTPFDPIAAKTAQKFKMEVIIAKGTDLKNLANIIKNKSFKGTTIHP